MLIDEASVPIKGVIFDFHGTLVDGGDADRWIEAAFRRLAEAGSAKPELNEGEIVRLREHLDQIWQHAYTIDPASERDLGHARHRDVFHRTVALCPGIKPELIAALYAVMPDQWIVFDDALPVLRELKSRGVRVVVLSNIGLDIRPYLDQAGVSDLLDGVVLSFEVGMVKPDPAIYAHALELLDVPGSQTLMVGDSPRDDVGGVSLKIRTLILPRTEGPVHGLGMVLQMVGNGGLREETAGQRDHPALMRGPYARLGCTDLPRSTLGRWLRSVSVAGPFGRCRLSGLVRRGAGWRRTCAVCW